MKTWWKRSFSHRKLSIFCLCLCFMSKDIFMLLPLPAASYSMLSKTNLNIDFISSIFLFIIHPTPSSIILCELPCENESHGMFACTNTHTHIHKHKLAYIRQLKCSNLVQCEITGKSAGAEHFQNIPLRFDHTNDDDDDQVFVRTCQIVSQINNLIKEVGCFLTQPTHKCYACERARMCVVRCLTFECLNLWTKH